ncbi:potassium channel family protein [Modestobacter excelsi]|uniref:potassium channel family protein n=1 Tax=Modestobacter excelsi TaxID=2213161 RepID=UPI00110CE530|nr:TrkA family potassium uptake protein [Modestobacter excelsi]
MGKNHEDSVLVVGLGRFGSSISTTLERLGHEVLAVDANLELVQEWSTRLRHVTQVDATSEDAMRQLGADQFDIAVVGIGDDIEASLLSTGVLLDLGLREVWAKAITPAHGRILERSGANHVIYPERDAGERTAHLLSGRLIDYIEFDDGFAIVKMKAPREALGKTLGESALRSKYGVTIIGVKRGGEDFAHAVPDTIVKDNDLLIVSGASHLIEKFAAEAC